MDSLSDKDLNIAVVCSDCNIGSFKNTASSIKGDFPKVSYFGVVPNNSTALEISDMSRYGRVIKGGDTITSLMSKGICESKDWCLLVMCGSWVRYNLVKKYRYFLKSKKDIIYPAVDRKYLFYEASINGILIHRDSFEDIGNFEDFEDLSESKLNWAVTAIDKGYSLKSIVGARFI